MLKGSFSEEMKANAIRMRNCFLTLMKKAKKYQKLIVVGTTNYPENIDLNIIIEFDTNAEVVLPDWNGRK